MMYGLQENLMDDGSCVLRVRVVEFVAIYMVCLQDIVMLQHVELL